MNVKAEQKQKKYAANMAEGTKNAVLWGMISVPLGQMDTAAYKINTVQAWSPKRSQ